MKEPPKKRKAQSFFTQSFFALALLNLVDNYAQVDRMRFQVDRNTIQVDRITVQVAQIVKFTRIPSPNIHSTYRSHAN